MTKVPKRKVLSKKDLMDAIESMSEEQFKDYAKDHNRECRDIILWSQGEEHIARGSFRLINDMIAKITQFEELEAYASEHPDDHDLKAQLTRMQMEIDNEFNDLEAKMDSFGGAITLLEKDEERYKAMATQFAWKAKRCGMQADRIRERVITVMQALALDEVKGVYFKAKMAKPSYELELNEMTEEMLAQVDPKFIKTKKFIHEPTVKQAILSGETIEWATLTAIPNVRIS